MSDAAPPPWLAPVLVSAYPLQEPDAQLTSKRAARQAAGFSPDGLDHPRGHLWTSRVLPVAVLDGIALIVLMAVLLVSDSALAIALSSAAVAILSGAALATVTYIRSDPLRLTDEQGRELARLKSWRSERAWNPTQATTPARALLSRAVAAVDAIVTTQAWRSSALQNHRLQLDLRAELDAIDEQAFQLATSENTAQLGKLAERVRTLEAYASALKTHQGNKQLVPDDTLSVSGSVRDEFATDRLRALTADLAGRGEQTYQ